MNTGDIPNLAECIDVGTIRVHAPTKVILLCGGTYDEKDHENGEKIPPRSLRDAFLRISFNKPYSKFQSIIPDEIIYSPPVGPYDELLQFESDLAQLSELVILFNESAGNLAELGAFSVVEEIAPRLLVVIDDKNFEKSSFIRHGPLHTLSKKHGDTSVFVMTLADIGLDQIDVSRSDNAKNIDLEAFAAMLSPAFSQRIEAVPSPSSLDMARSGHKAKLITGLIQHYGALSAEEIVAILDSIELPIDLDTVRKLLFCSEQVGWISHERRGFKTFYVATTENSAFSFELRLGMPAISRKTWKIRIKDYWRTHDTERFKSISNLAAAEAA